MRRLLFAGQVAKSVTFFVEAATPNLGKTLPDRKNIQPAVIIQDAYGEWVIYQPRYVSKQCYDTYMPKLTLSVDEKVVRGAKRYAAAQGTSVSRLVERYLGLLSRPFDMDQAPPVLRMLRGAARHVPADAHRKHLVRKYR